MTNDSIYSPLKIFHHQDRLNAVRRGEFPPPIHVQIIPINLCNHDCSFCAYRISGYSSNAKFSESDQIPLDKVLEVVDDCGAMGVRAIEITGGGEPTIYRGFGDLCRRIRDGRMDYGIVTNGSRADRYREDLLRAKWVRVSIDAATQETYSSVRRVNPRGYDRVRRGLRGLVEARGSRTDPVIGVGFVVTENNWREVLQAARYAREDGADNFRISAVFQGGGAEYFREFHDRAKELFRESAELEDSSFKVFNLYGDRIEDLTQRSPDYSFCGVQRFATYVGADQNVYRCCVLGYNPRGLLGSVVHQSFRELWESDELRRRLEDFDARECPRCMFNNKNRTILYALEDDPPHVNFL